MGGGIAPSPLPAGVGAPAAAGKRCALGDCGRALPPQRTGKYCSDDCANAARRLFHKHNPGANRAKRQAPAFAPRPSSRPARTAHLRSAQQQKARREREHELAAQRAATEERREEAARPRYRLGYDPGVVIGPPRPAPLKRYRDTGLPCAFQDDLAAIADRGSPGPLSREPFPGLGASSLVGR